MMMFDNTVVKFVMLQIKVFGIALRRKPSVILTHMLACLAAASRFYRTEYSVMRFSEERDQSSLHEVSRKINFFYIF